MRKALFALIFFAAFAQLLQDVPELAFILIALFVGLVLVMLGCKIVYMRILEAYARHRARAMARRDIRRYNAARMNR